MANFQTFKQIKMPTNNQTIQELIKNQFQRAMEISEMISRTSQADLLEDMPISIENLISKIRRQSST